MLTIVVPCICKDPGHVWVPGDMLSLFVGALLVMLRARCMAHSSTEQVLMMMRLMMMMGSCGWFCTFVLLAGCPWACLGICIPGACVCMHGWYSYMHTGRLLLASLIDKLHSHYHYKPELGLAAPVYSDATGTLLN